jgi:hypothetical protein
VHPAHHTMIDNLLRLRVARHVPADLAVAVEVEPVRLEVLVDGECGADLSGRRSRASREHERGDLRANLGGRHQPTLPKRSSVTGGGVDGRRGSLGFGE